MSLSSYELERFADDIYKDRRITGSVYCGNCGYNLHTLPYIYTCPECGSQYNARPLAMHGIFAPHEIEFPFRDILAALVCAVTTLVIGYPALKSLQAVRLAFAVVFAGLTIWFAWYADIRLGRYFKAVAIARRIAAQEKEEE
ncbi:MAG: hypothetical protein WBE26_17690 [Phycisphaerae bacterium]